MSDSSKRNPDPAVNNITIVVVGICGSVLVYVSVLLLQAFYASDTAEVSVMSDYGGQDSQALSLKAEQLSNLSMNEANGQSGTFTIPIELAKKLVLANVKTDPSTLIPALGKSDQATAAAVYGRPQPLVAAPPVPAPATDAVPAVDTTTAPAADGATPVAPAAAGAAPAADGATPVAPASPPAAAASPAPENAAPAPANGSAAPAGGNGQ